MLTDRFEELLKELGKTLNMPLHPDKNHACLLNINNTLRVQLEEDLPQERILVASFLGEIPPGKYRENILKEALKANGHLEGAALSYSARNNKLVLFGYLYYPNLTGAKCADYLSKFIDIAQLWRNTLETGRAPKD